MTEKTTKAAISASQQIERVRCQLTDALVGVRAELRQSQSGHSAVDSEQNLQRIAASLESMLSGLDQAVRPQAPGLWHIVTDMWPHTSALRHKIVEAEHGYERLR
jgi:hypothetical protein